MNWITSVRQKREDWLISHANHPIYLCVDVATWRAMRDELQRDYQWPEKGGLSVRLLGLIIVVVPGAAELFTLAGEPDVELRIAELAALSQKEPV